MSPAGDRSLRLGLCCLFSRELIKFHTTTATAMLRLGRRERLAQLADPCFANADALLAALRYCAAHGIAADTINIRGGGAYGDKVAALEHRTPAGRGARLPDPGE